MAWSIPDQRYVLRYAIIIILFCVACAGDEGDTVYISQAKGSEDKQLVDAVLNPRVTTIVFTTDYDVGSQFDPWNGPFKDGVPYIPVNRNITMTGLPGQNPLVDLGFKLSVIELCKNCTLTMKNMSITNDRFGASAMADFFLGQGESIIHMINVVRKRLSCTPIDSAVRLVRDTARAPNFPGPNGTMDQVYGVEDVEFRGQLFPQTLYLKNYSVWFPRHYNGGYSLWPRLGSPPPIRSSHSWFTVSTQAQSLDALPIDADF
eukprot:gene12509-12643_t